jgi:hypothetical protein
MVTSKTPGSKGTHEHLLVLSINFPYESLMSRVDQSHLLLEKHVLSQVVAVQKCQF